MNVFVHAQNFENWKGDEEIYMDAVHLLPVESQHLTREVFNCSESRENLRVNV